MHKYVLDSLLWIEKKDLGEIELERLRDRLTITPRSSQTNPNPAPVALYTETESQIGLPRHYGMLYIKDVNLVNDLRTDERGKVNFDCSINLWDTQLRPFNDAVNGLLNTASNGGIIQIGCGGGKTIIAMKIMAELKAPTLIILHDKGLLAQWVEECKKHLNLTKDDIGIVMQKKCVFENKKVVFCVTQSLHARGSIYPEELYKWPTLLIYDEVHRIGARTFCTWTSKFRSKYRLGLSATPRRWDGMEDIFYWNIGYEIATGKPKTLKPDVYIIQLPSLVPDLKNREGIPLKATMISRLSGTRTPKGTTKAVSSPSRISMRRNLLIANDLLDALSKGRKVLVISDRIAQLEELERYIKARHECKTGWWIGKSSNVKKMEAKKADIVFACYTLGAEGMDVPHLDVIAMITPRSDVEQAVGRVCRYMPDKKTPLVLDYCDPNDAFKSSADARLRFYRNNGYKVRWIVKS